MRVRVNFATLRQESALLAEHLSFRFVRVRRASATRSLSFQARSSFNDIKFTIRYGGIFAGNDASWVILMNSNCHGWCAYVPMEIRIPHRLAILSRLMFRFCLSG